MVTLSAGYPPPLPKKNPLSGTADHEVEHGRIVGEGRQLAPHPAAVGDSAAELSLHHSHRRPARGHFRQRNLPVAVNRPSMRPPEPKKHPWPARTSRARSYGMSVAVGAGRDALGGGSARHSGRSDVTARLGLTSRGHLGGRLGHRKGRNSREGQLQGVPERRRCRGASIGRPRV